MSPCNGLLLLSFNVVLSKRMGFKGPNSVGFSYHFFHVQVCIIYRLYMNDNIAFKMRSMVSGHDCPRVQEIVK